MFGRREELREAGAGEGGFSYQWLRGLVVGSGREEVSEKSVSIRVAAYLAP